MRQVFWNWSRKLHFLSVSDWRQPWNAVRFTFHLFRLVSKLSLVKWPIQKEPICNSSFLVRRIVLFFMTNVLLLWLLIRNMPPRPGLESDVGKLAKNSKRLLCNPRRKKYLKVSGILYSLSAGAPWGGFRRCVVILQRLDRRACVPTLEEHNHTVIHRDLVSHWSWVVCTGCSSFQSDIFHWTLDCGPGHWYSGTPAASG